MKKGFTLVELLVVVLIIAILAAVALPQYTTAVERSRATEALTLLAAVAESAQRYKFHQGVWPTDWDQLDVDIPRLSGETEKYGGKNFEVLKGTVATSGDDSYYYITANRRLSEDNDKYHLTLTLLDSNDSTTITVTRCCGRGSKNSSGGCTKFSSSSDKKKRSYVYCNSITGGSNTDF